MTEEKLIGGQGQDPFNVQPPGRESRFVFAIPTEDKAIVCKLLFDPRGKQSYIPVDYYNHQIGPNKETDTRSHPSRKSLGLGDSPENDAYWDYAKQLSVLRKEGKGETPEAKKLEKLKDMFYARQKGWLYFVTPGSATIYALKITKAVINSLFGKDATQYRPEVKSILKEMGSNNMSPYDISSKVGWLKLYKTGQKLATEYHVEVAETTIQVDHNGRKIPAKQPFEADVHEKIKNSDVTLDDFPDPVKFEIEQCWSLEESQAFVDSAGTVVPERCLKKNQGKFDETQEAAPAAAETAQTTTETAAGTDDTDLDAMNNIPEAAGADAEGGPSTPELDEIPF